MKVKLEINKQNRPVYTYPDGITVMLCRIYPETTYKQGRKKADEMHKTMLEHRISLMDKGGV